MGEHTNDDDLAHLSRSDQAIESRLQIPTSKSRGRFIKLKEKEGKNGAEENVEKKER